MHRAVRTRMKRRRATTTKSTASIHITIHAPLAPQGSPWQMARYVFLTARVLKSALSRRALGKVLARSSTPEVSLSRRWTMACVLVGRCWWECVYSAGPVDARAQIYTHTLCNSSRSDYSPASGSRGSAPLFPPPSNGAPPRVAASPSPRSRRAAPPRGAPCSPR